MAITFLLIFAGACYGWGRLVNWACYRREGTPVAYDMALGVAVLSFLGGVLNLVAAVSSVALHCLLGGGIAATILFATKALRSVRGATIRDLLASHGPRLRYLVIPWSVALVLILFWAWALLPTAALNIFDDFHTYLVRPMRMLATGTVGGNPFEALGLDSLGAQSFFHCFVLTWCPITYVNAFDGVICFGLCALLIVAVGRELDVPWGYSVVALLAFASINPQIVNISPAYSGAAMILGLIVACSRFDRGFSAGSLRVAWPRLVPIILFASCLVSLKSTLALFAAAVLLIFFAVLLVRAGTRKQTLLAALSVALGTFLLVVPWLIVVPITYAPAARAVAETGATALSATQSASIVARDTKGLFMSQPLLYGGLPLYYNFAVVCVTLCGAMFLWHVLRGKTSQASRAWVVSTAAVACASPVVYLINAYVFDAVTGIRYSCVFILAAFPMVSLVAVRLLSGDGQSMEATSVRPVLRASRILPLTANLSIIFLFFGTTAQRFGKAVNARTQVAYPIDQTYLDFHHAAFSKSTVGDFRRMQALTEAGGTILVWSGMPFFLDFQRNRILTASEPGIINPWLRFPVGVAPDALQKYLLAFGIRYVLFQSEGYSVTSVPELIPYKDGWPVYRKLADYNIYAKRALVTLSQRHRVLYRNEYTVLFDLTAPEAGESQTMTQRIREDTGLN